MEEEVSLPLMLRGACKELLSRYRRMRSAQDRYMACHFGVDEMRQAQISCDDTVSRIANYLEGLALVEARNAKPSSDTAPAPPEPKPRKAKAKPKKTEPVEEENLLFDFGDSE